MLRGRFLTLCFNDCTIPGNWSRYNLCDILTKPVQLSLYKRPDKRIPKFILCAVQDTKRQTSSIKQKLSPSFIAKHSFIQACRVHSGSFPSDATGKCSLLLFFRFGHIALKLPVVLAVVQDSVAIKR